MTYQESVVQFKREYWTRLLAETAGNLSEAARRAGVNRTYAVKLVINQLGIERPPAHRGNWGDL